MKCPRTGENCKEACEDFCDYGTPRLPDDCSRHKEDLYGEKDLQKAARVIADMGYGALYQLIYFLSKEIDADAERDNKDGKEKTAAALQYLGFGLFESALRAEKLWLLVKPFMDQ